MSSFKEEIMRMVNETNLNIRKIKQMISDKVRDGSGGYDGLLNQPIDAYASCLQDLNEAGLEQQLSQDVQFWKNNLDQMQSKNKDI